MKTILVIALSLFCSILLTASDKWGKVDNAVFKKQTYDIDTSAGAVVLFDKCEISFKVEYGTFTAVYKVHKRIQILNKSGIEYADVEIPYHFAANRENINHLSAQTINIGLDGKQQVTKVDATSMFERKVNDNVRKKKFAFPAVRDGSVIEYEYILESQNVWYLRDWFFQNEIPTLYSSVELIVPPHIHYTQLLQSSIPLSKHIEEEQDVQVGETTIWGETTLGTRISEEKRAADGPKGMYYFYEQKNIPALKEEAYVNNLNDYASKIIFVLVSTDFPGHPEQHFSKTWEGIGENLLKEEGFDWLKFRQGDHVLKAKGLTSNISSASEKISVLYDHITSVMKWNEEHSFFTSEKPQRIYSLGIGNSADINMLLIDMLKGVGVKAFPVLISTREHGKIQKVFPELKQFNHLLVMAEADSGDVLLDAANPAKSLDFLPTDDLNSEGLLLLPGITRWIPLKPYGKSSETVSVSLSIDEKGLMTGKANFVSEGYPALNIRNMLSGMKAEDIIKDELVIENEMEMQDSRVEQITGNRKTKLSWSFNMSGMEEGKSVIYLHPFAAKFLEDNPFKLKKRTYPVNFVYPIEQTIKISIGLPANYKISELPAPQKLKLEDGSVTYNFVVGKGENNIQLNSNLKILKSEYAAEMYEGLKEIYAKMIDSFNSLIVLERTN